MGVRGSGGQAMDHRVVGQGGEDGTLLSRGVSAGSLLSAV